MSSLYPKGCAHLLGQPTKKDLIADTIKLLAYNGAFVSTHEFVSDLTAGSIVFRSGAFAGKTVTNGVFDANDLTVTSVTGASFTHLIIFKDTGVDASSPLTGMWDVPVFTPNGADVTVVFSGSGIFSIASP